MILKLNYLKIKMLLTKLGIGLFLKKYYFFNWNKKYLLKIKILNECRSGKLNFINLLTVSLLLRKIKDTKKNRNGDKKFVRIDNSEHKNMIFVSVSESKNK